MSARSRSTRIEGIDGIVTVPFEDLGIDELVSSGIPWHESERQVVLRACQKIGLESAVTPRAFPLEQADFLRANGISLEPDGDVFDKRRRVKNESELTGIRRAQAGAERAMGAIRDRLREGGDLTCEELQGLALQSFSESGVIAPDMVIVSHGEQTAIGHEPGHGPIVGGEAVIADLYPQDPVSGCYADMTRTFCMGEPPEELVRYHGLVKEALDRAVDAIRPGITGKELHRMTCEFFQEHGFLTQLTKDPDKPLEDGFFHGLGHGVGLEVHEQPGSDAPARSSWPATFSPSSRASTARASGVAGSRISCSSWTTAPRSSPSFPTTYRLSREREQLLEAVRVVERPDRGEVQPLLADDVLRDALDVLERDGVEAGQHLVRLAELALEHLVPQAEHDHPLRALERQDKAALGEVPRLLELVRLDGSAAMRPNSCTTVVTASSIRWMSTPPCA